VFDGHYPVLIFSIHIGMASIQFMSKTEVGCTGGTLHFDHNSPRYSDFNLFLKHSVHFQKLRTTGEMNDCLLGEQKAEI